MPTPTPDPTDRPANAAADARPGRPAPARLVIVDDEPLHSQELTELLRSLGHDHVVTLDGREPWLEALRCEQPDLVLLELDLRDGSAAALLGAMRRDRLLRRVPVLALHTLDDPVRRRAALAAGVSDILQRPFDAQEFALRLAQRLAARRELESLAYTDAATGLPNREWTLRRLDEAIRSALRYQHAGALLQIGLSDGKRLADTLGLLASDELLRELGRRLRASVRDTDLVALQPDTAAAGAVQVARSDGDEFSVLLPRLERPDQAAIVAARIASALAQPLEVGGQTVAPACRIGIAVFPDDGRSADAVLERAMIASHQGADDGAGTSVGFYARALTGRYHTRLVLERELRLAIPGGELRLHYQPKVCLASGYIAGAEALVRWQHPRRGLLAPGHFIALAEDSGLIGALGLWVLREAVRQAAAWQRAGHALSMAVNVSCHQLRSPGLVEQVRAVLHAEQLDPGRLCLELTESAVMDSGATSTAALAALKQLGVQLALDDFGTGYSSLSYLRTVPLDELKIDRSFIEECRSACSSAAIITDALVAMAHGLGLRVVAEGIETMEQLDFLRRNGCDQVQGYLVGRPMPAAAFEALLQAQPELCACPA